MKITIPTLNKYFPLLLIGGGGMVLFWMSLEDHSANNAAIIGITSSFLLGLQSLLRRYGGQSLAVRWLPLTGLLVGGVLGAASALSTALLMFFKTAWHAHPYPDFPPQMILAMLERLPVWGIAGGLAGLGLVLVGIAIRNNGIAARP
ncbi:MAG: hypothetical protein KC496_12285 [Anaerolineae bacterium]|nr:hypothetical protein [Anaerolineae bacterium]